ncbi:hypothetical protein MRX96_032964 [Rhipicephalus microplus]
MDSRRSAPHAVSKRDHWANAFPTSPHARASSVLRIPPQPSPFLLEDRKCKRGIEMRKNTAAKNTHAYTKTRRRPPQIVVISGATPPLGQCYAHHGNGVSSRTGCEAIKEGCAPLPSRRARISLPGRRYGSMVCAVSPSTVQPGETCENVPSSCLASRRIDDSRIFRRSLRCFLTVTMSSKLHGDRVKSHRRNGTALKCRLRIKALWPRRAVR